MRRRGDLRRFVLPLSYLTQPSGFLLTQNSDHSLMLHGWVVSWWNNISISVDKLWNTFTRCSMLTVPLQDSDHYLVLSPLNTLPIHTTRRQWIHTIMSNDGLLISSVHDRPDITDRHLTLNTLYLLTANQGGQVYNLTSKRCSRQNDTFIDGDLNVSREVITPQHFTMMIKQYLSGQ